jgi:hypothetical protein
VTRSDPPIAVLDRLRRLAKRTVPAPLLDRIEPVVSALPDRIGVRINPQKYAEMPPGPPQPLVLEGGSVRLIIGPTNTAGQGFHWARAVDALPDHAALSIGFVDEKGFRFPVHRAVPSLRAVRSVDWQRAEFSAIAASATHVLIESARPLFGPLFRGDIVREVRALRRRGVRVAVVAHGSDVRDVRAHQRREPHSPYAHPELVPDAADLDAAAARTRATLARLGVPLFGSTPSVAFDLPTAAWLPVVIDPERWATDAPVLERPVPVVVHAPSHAGVKGSEVADQVLARLQAEGAIVYRRLAAATHDEVRRAFREADIVVDSLRMGGYGAAACEAMAAGRLVLSYINDYSRGVVEGTIGEQPPIGQADVVTLEQSLRSALADRAGARALAARGPAFVRRGHDGRASAAALAAFLRS